MDYKDVAWTLALSYGAIATRQALVAQRGWLENQTPMPQVVGTAAAVWFAQNAGFIKAFQGKWTDLLTVVAVHQALIALMAPTLRDMVRWEKSYYLQTDIP